MKLGNYISVSINSKNRVSQRRPGEAQRETRSEFMSWNKNFCAHECLRLPRPTLGDSYGPLTKVGKLLAQAWELNRDEFARRMAFSTSLILCGDFRSLSVTALPRYSRRRVNISRVRVPVSDDIGAFLERQRDRRQAAKLWRHDWTSLTKK